MRMRKSENLARAYIPEQEYEYTDDTLLEAE